MTRTLDTAPDSGAPAQGPGSSASTRRRWRIHTGDGALRYRLGVASRAVAAIGGGYAVSAMVAAVLALYLPTSRVEAALTGTMAAFVVYTCAVMWVFAARSALRAWLGLLCLALPLGVLLLWHYQMGGAA